MKRMLATLMLGCLLAGCNTLPMGIRTSLYTAQITLDVTVMEVDAATIAPFALVPGETSEQLSARKDRQIGVLTDVLRQANRNLKTVVEYVRGDKEGG